MLDDVDRVVYLDVDTLMLGDVVRPRPHRPRRPPGRGPRLQRQRGERVAPRRTARCRRGGHRAAARHRAAGTATGRRANAGVLVDGPRPHAAGRLHGDHARLGRAATGSTTRTRMLAYAGPDRAVLDPRWNALPVLEDVARPEPHPLGQPRQALGAQPDLRAGRAGVRYAAQLQQRAGRPPTGDRPTADPGASASAPAPGRRSGPSTTPLAAGAGAGHRRGASRSTSATWTRPACGRSRRRSKSIEAEGIEGLIIETGTALRRLGDHDGRGQVDRTGR